MLRFCRIECEGVSILTHLGADAGILVLLQTIRAS